LNADALCEAIRRSRGFVHKRDLADVMRLLHGATGAAADADGADRAVAATASAIPVGDDCAVIPDGDGYLLFAIEGFVEDFVTHSPWFAGYCGVMVNVSDIYAMGGRPLAVVDALWSHGTAAGATILEGLTVAARRYGVPLVGGHSNARADRAQLAVAIIGRATRLLSSFAAKPGDRLVMAVDLRGRYQEPFPYWNASSDAPAPRLRADLEVLPWLAENGLCAAAKDISMAGALGTSLMMLECSRMGAVIRVESIPRPACADDAALLRWLTAFPSYGFILSIDPQHVRAVMQRFVARDLAVAVIGEVTEGPQVHLAHYEGSALLWDFAEQPFMAAAPDQAPIAESSHE
jgi:AIR synthase-related protein